MPHPHTIWRTDRPAEGFYATTLPADPARVVHTFLPEGYEPRYPYPLLVLFAGAETTPDAVLRLASLVSRRNYIAITLAAAPDLAAPELADAVTSAVEQTRRAYHIHTERVHLIGIGAGTAAAFQAGFVLGDKIAGIAGLNGYLPRPTPGEPLFRLDAVRGSRVLLAHAAATSEPDPIADRDQRLLYAAGATVTVRRYKAPVVLPPELLRDVNRWVMAHVTATPSLVPAGR